MRKSDKRKRQVAVLGGALLLLLALCFSSVVTAPEKRSDEISLPQNESVVVGKEDAVQKHAVSDMVSENSRLLILTP